MTKISLTEVSKKQPRAGLAVYFLLQGAPFEGLPFSTPDLKEMARREKFEARKEQTLLVLRADASLPRVLLVGLGKAPEFDLEFLRRAACRAARQARDLKVAEALFILPAELPRNNPASAMAGAAAEGVWLGLYKFREYQSKQDERKDPAAIQLLFPGLKAPAEAAKAVERSRILAESVT